MWFLTNGVVPNALIGSYASAGNQKHDFDKADYTTVAIKGFGGVAWRWRFVVRRCDLAFTSRRSSFRRVKAKIPQQRIDQISVSSRPVLNKRQTAPAWLHLTAIINIHHRFSPLDTVSLYRSAINTRPLSCFPPTQCQLTWIHFSCFIKYYRPPTTRPSCIKLVKAYKNSIGQHELNPKC